MRKEERLENDQINPHIDAEIELCENDIAWLIDRIEILKKLKEASKTPTVMQKINKLLSELE